LIHPLCQWAAVRRLNLSALFFLFVLLFQPLLNADVLKENYIVFSTESGSPVLVVDFESDNLENHIHLDTNENGIISWKEIEVKQEKILRYVLPHIRISTDEGYCKKNLKSFSTKRRGHQTYIKLEIRLSCANPKNKVKVFYDLFFDEDKEQKAFLSIKEEGRSLPVVLSPRAREVVVALKNTSLFINFRSFIYEGVWHIWLGFDHILFLIMLLVPSVTIYEKRKIITQVPLRTGLVSTLKVVTAFSVAHSITLVLSVLDVVNVHAQFIEICIALSVVFAALNNVFVAVSRNLWMLSFGFGLLHGFGFASVLKEMLLENKDFGYSLLGFNLGVEVGQIALVVAIVPFIYITRNTWFYRYVILYGLSLLTAVVASIWAYERLFNISILPF
jgi:hypothetical protein